MQCKPAITSLSACLLLAINGSASAAQAVDLNKASFSNLKQEFALTFPGVAQLSSGSAVNHLKFIKKRTDKNNVSHTRMQQMYAGFPVIGGYAILHNRGNSQALMTAADAVKMDGMVYQNLADDLGQKPADFVRQGDKALEAFVKPYASQQLSEQSVSPVVYMDDKNKAHWAYKVSVMVESKDKIPARPCAIIDAKTHKPFVEWNDVKTIKTEVHGKGFGGNEKMGMYQYGEGSYPYLELTRDGDEALCYMENQSVRVVDMEHGYSSKKAPMNFKCSEDQFRNGELVFWTGYDADGYDEVNGAYSPTNDALYAGFVIKHMYTEWYGVEPLVKSNGSPMQMIMRVHYGRGYENAYWDGRQMTFGDGEDMLYPLVSLGVGAHEISHGFTEQHADLAYYGQSGGMNESFSDMAAQAAEYYSLGKNTWQIGPEIMKPESGYDALRYMDKPSKDGMSIDSAEDYYGGLDVHYSSGVFNRLFYLLSETPEWNVRKAFDVMVKANMDYWTPYTNFQKGGCGVLKATSDLGYSLSDVRTALEKVGISHEECDA